MDMTLRELQVYVECPRKYEIGRLAIGEENRYRCWELAIQHMCRLLEKRESISQIKKWVLLFLQRNYQLSWFQLPWQKDDVARQDAAYFSRFLDTVSYDQIAEIRSNRVMKIEAGKEFADRYVENILFRIHLLLTYQNGEHEAIIFNRRFARRYSYRAKQEAHKPASCPELAAMLYALRDLPDFKVSLIQLIGEGDHINQLEAFEKKPGANRISIRAGDMRWTARQTYEKMISGINMAEKNTCTKCQHESTCRISQKIYLQGNQEDRTVKVICYSKEQEEVINRHTGNIRVSAGPGSGKTAVIAGRIESMIQAGIPADKILVLTYTREAVKELSGRMRKDRMPHVSTIHSLAYQILLENKEITGTMRLAEQLDKKALLLRVLKHAPKLEGMSYDGMQLRYGLLQTLLNYFAYIDRNGEAKFRETYWKKDVDGVLQIKDFFDSAFQKCGYITYDEQISEAISLLLNNPGILRKEQQKHPYIMIDEAQDLDAEQVNLIRLLAGDTGNLMIVGDDDQAIFGFRGGSNEFMLRFKSLYPAAEDMVLGKNYRSYEEIVQVANALINNNQNRIPKKMVSALGARGMACTHIEEFAERQIPVLLCEIKKSLGCRWSDIAVITKNNKELYGLCDILETHNKGTYQETKIPFERPKYYLREDAVFCGIYDLLTLSVKGMGDDLALFRLLTNLGVYGIEKEDKKKSLYQDLLNRKLIYSVEEQDLLYYSVTTEDSMLLQAFSKICKAKAALCLSEVSHAVRLAAANLFMDQNLDYAPVLEGMDELIQEKGIKTLMELQALLEMIWFLGDSARIRYSGGKDQVRFLTAHDAKGQQFQAVFIYAIDLFESGNVEEDRRLLYVAMTRAEKCLITSELLKGKSNFLRDFIDYMKVWR